MSLSKYFSLCEDQISFLISFQNSPRFPFLEKEPNPLYFGHPDLCCNLIRLKTNGIFRLKFSLLFKTRSYNIVSHVIMPSEFNIVLVTTTFNNNMDLHFHIVIAFNQIYYLSQLSEIRLTNKTFSQINTLSRMSFPCSCPIQLLSTSLTFT